MTHSGHGLIIEILAHVFCAISQLSDPNNPYYGASIEITHFLKFFKISNFFKISALSDRQQPETEKRDAVGQFQNYFQNPPTPKRIWPR